ncbi:MAG: hypothetical protein K8S23_09415, partial [Candidatus Cloacimonetes bacterium]|nr:hypothetical protein [Candidatus Cloacimonadota bacterium]
AAKFFLLFFQSELGAQCYVYLIIQQKTIMICFVINTTSSLTNSEPSNNSITKKETPKKESKI